MRLADCKTRDVGYALAAHYTAKGLKAASVKKIVGRLGAVNLAHKDGKLRELENEFNPFHGVVSSEKIKKEATRRKLFSDADIAKIWANLDKPRDDGTRVWFGPMTRLRFA